MILNILLCLPLLGCLIVACLPYHLFRYIRVFGFLVTNVVFVAVVCFWIFGFDSTSGSYQVFNTYFFQNDLNLSWTVGLDGISLPFILLTSFIFPLCFLSVWKKANNLKSYIFCLLFLEFTVLGVFLTNDLLFFFLFFESSLIPMFFLIGVWGSGINRLVASYYFFFFTAIGSVFLFFSIFLIFLNTGSTSIVILNHFAFENDSLRLFLFLGIVLSFLVKLPMFPFHVWLPEAHVQAPTEGSVILACLLLKLGGYGIIRILLSSFKESILYLFPLFSILCTCGVVYCAFSALVQIDLKKLIAYASVSHMNLILISLFTLNIFGLQGGIFMMLGHGLVASLFFFLIGFLYDRHQTRNVLYFSGLVHAMPIFVIFFFFASLSNVSMPLTCNFVGEFLMFLGLVENHAGLAFFLIFFSTVGVAYSFFLFNSFVFMNLKQNFIIKYKDLTRIEVMCVGYLLVLIIVFGIFPNKILFISEMASRHILTVICV